MSRHSHSDDEFKISPRSKQKKCLHFDFKLKGRGSAIQCRYIKEILAHNLKSTVDDLVLNSQKRLFIMAVNTNNIELIQKLLNQGLDPNFVDNQKRTPLHLAVSKGYTDVVQLLLQNGAKQNRKDILGNTPLHLATCTTNVKIIKMLLEAGANITMKDLNHRTPLNLAKSKYDILQRSYLGSIDSGNRTQVLMKEVILVFIFLFNYTYN